MSSFSVSNSNGRFTLTLTVNEDATSIENNTSTLSYTLVLTANTSWDFDEYHIGHLITLDGGDASYCSRGDSPQYSCGAYSSVTIASGDNFGVVHNSDGSKTISVAFSIDMDSEDYTPGPLSYNGSMALTTIPRASVLNAISNFDVDSGVSVRITKYYSGFCDDIYVSYAGTQVGSYHDASDGTVVHFTADQLSTIYSLMSTVKSGTFTVSSNTYGDSLIGSSSTTATGSISNANPTLSASVADVNSATIALTGSSAKLVKYKSTARVTLSASGNKGASITSKVVNGTAVSGTTLDLANISVTPLTVTATDSRGNSTTVTLNPVVVPYVQLTCNASFYRPEPTTGEVRLKLSGNYYNGSFGAVYNSIAASWAYRVKGATSWSSATAVHGATASGNTYALAETNLGTGFDYTQAYEFILYYSDAATNASTGTLTVTRGLPIMDWGKNDVNINGGLSVRDFALLPVITGQGDASSYFHHLDIGHSGFDHWDFYDYGGVYNFYKCTSGAKADAALLASITASGITALGKDVPTIQYGTWVPVLGSRAGTAPTYSASTVVAHYARIGNLVFIYLCLRVSITAAGTDYACVKGLPFADLLSNNNWGHSSLSIGESYFIFSGTGTNDAKAASLNYANKWIDLQHGDGAGALQWIAASGGLSIAGWYMIL